MIRANEGFSTVDSGLRQEHVKTRTDTERVEQVRLCYRTMTVDYKEKKKNE